MNFDRLLWDMMTIKLKKMLAVINVVAIYEGEKMYNPDEKSKNFFLHHYI